MCINLPPPPPEVSTVLEEPPPDRQLTTREHVELTHSGNPDCRNCHDFIDGVGFTFEHFDALGRYRSDEYGLPIDPTGQIMIGESFVEVADSIEMAGILQESQAVRACLGQHLFQYAMGVSGESQAGQCVASQVAQTWNDSNGNPLSIIETITTSDAFRYLSSD